MHHLLHHYACPLKLGYCAEDECPYFGGMSDRGVVHCGKGKQADPKLTRYYEQKATNQQKAWLRSINKA